MREPTPAPVTTAAATDRQYLLERIGEAAVVQVYADGFRDLCRFASGPWSGTWARRPSPAATSLRPAASAHSLEMRDVVEAIVTHPSGVDRSTLDEIVRYY
jgi:hypothetical protein